MLYFLTAAAVSRGLVIFYSPLWPPSSGWRCGTRAQGEGSPPARRCAPLRPLCTCRTAGGWSTSPTSPERQKEKSKFKKNIGLFLFSTEKSGKQKQQQHDEAGNMRNWIQLFCFGFFLTWSPSLISRLRVSNDPDSWRFVQTQLHKKYSAKK